MAEFNWSKIEKKIEQAGEKASEVVDNLFGAVDEIFSATGEAFKDIKEELSSKLQTDHMLLKVTDKDVVINGDVNSVKLNGKFIHANSKEET